MEALSGLELDTLDGLRHGQTTAKIAKTLGSSSQPVKHHVKAACDKLEASDRTEAVAGASEPGLLSQAAKSPPEIWPERAIARH